MGPNPFVLDISKVEYLDDNNYRRWVERMLFYFVQVEDAHVQFMEPKCAEFTMSETIVIEFDDIIKRV